MMTKQELKIVAMLAKPATENRLGFTIGRKAFAAISAVEGIPPLTDEDYAVIDECKGMSSAERVARILAHVKGKRK